MAVENYTQAAKLVGISRVTLHKHLTNGKVTGTTAPDGSKGIDTSELLRVYGTLAVNDTANNGVKSNHSLQQPLQVEIDRLQVELRAAQELVAAQVKTINAQEIHLGDLRQLLLAHKPDPQPVTAGESQPDPQPMVVDPQVVEATRYEGSPQQERGFWSRFFGGGK